MLSKKTSFIAILVVIVISTIILLKTSYTQYSVQKNLKDINVELRTNRDHTSKLDSISMILQEAENNFRTYTLLWKKPYFVKYNKQISDISRLLSSLSKAGMESTSSGMARDLTDKKKQTQLYATIKKATDSLLSINLVMDTNEHSETKTAFKSRLKSVTKKIIKTEENDAPAEPKKARLFQRLKSAIFNKDSKKDTTKGRRVQIIYVEQNNENELNTKKQLYEMEQFYKGLLKKQRENHQALSQKEQQLLKINERIFGKIKLMFNEFNEREALIDKQRKAFLNDGSMNALMVIDRSGKISFIISLVIVLTTILLLRKLYQAYDEILKTNKLVSDQVIVKSRFFTSISHEMRTPLNSILGVTEQLKSTTLNEDQKNMTNLLESSSSMLLSAVNEILDFSRLETGKLTLSKKPFQYKGILTDVIGSMRVLAEQKGLEIKLDIKDQPDVMLTGDPYRLKQILLNLVANAIKFTDHGNVSINASLQEVTQASATLVLQVKDTGIGIAEKDLPFIFNEFSQVINSKRSDWQQGSGLGLPICKKLVDIHHGKISVSSVVAEGTTFKVELPYPITTEVPEGATNQSPVLQTDAFKHIRLLVVDDVQMNLMMIGMILKKHLISFDSVTNGEEALRLFEQSDYDMVLTDIEMPGMDGVELTKKIRGNINDQKAQRPIIAITGHISPESHEYYLSCGVNDYLIKPYTEKDLLEKILDYLP